jgi:nucleoside-diphosphate-sugar epimerase
MLSFRMHEPGGRILVTGAHGLIGVALCRNLINSGREVLALGRRKQAPFAHDGMRYCNVDLTAVTQLDVEDPEVGGVVHLAAELPRSFDAAGEVAARNQKMDNVVLSYARQHALPLVDASSTSVYARPTDDVPATEATPVSPQDDFARQKLDLEVMGEKLSQETGCRFSALRISAPYGPGQQNSTVIKVFLQRGLAGEPTTYHGDGSRAQSFTDCEDVAQACAAACEGHGGMYNIASEEPVTMKALVTTVVELCALSPSLAAASGEPDPQASVRYVYDIRKATQELGWSPATSLRTGLVQFRDWLRTIEA